MIKNYKEYVLTMTAASSAAAAAADAFEAATADADAALDSAAAADGSVAVPRARLELVPWLTFPQCHFTMGTLERGEISLK